MAMMEKHHARGLEMENDLVELWTTFTATETEPGVPPKRLVHGRAAIRTKYMDIPQRRSLEPNMIRQLQQADRADLERLTRNGFWLTWAVKCFEGRVIPGQEKR
jgi:hypothetical protein